MNHETVGEKQPRPTTGALSDRQQSRLVGLSALAVAAIVFGGFGWLAWQARSNPEVPYLPAWRGAEWILYPRPQWLTPHYAVPIDGSFVRAVDLSDVPTHAALTWRAFRQADVWVNGQAVAPDEPGGSWKSARRADAADHLRVGRNVIRVRVTNDDGPPALWLRLEGDGVPVVATDASWQTNLSGSHFTSAVLATASPPRRLWIERIYQLTPRNALKEAAGNVELAGLVGLVVAVLILSLSFFARSARDPNLPAQRWSQHWLWPWIAWAIVSVGWFIVVANNHPWLTVNMGFDAQDHLAYVEYIQQHHRLPLAEEGREMHQPPLFYVIAAGCVSAFGADADSPRGHAIIRGFTAFLGAIHFGLIGASLRIIFPAERLLWLIGLLFAAVLPMNLYMFQYISNESLTAVTSAAVIYVALTMLRNERISLLQGATLGVLLGAALLSKITALVLPPVVLIVLAGRMFLRGASPRQWMAAVVVPFVICVVVSGWQYYRNWSHYGTLLVRHINLPGTYASATWKDPGVRTWKDFLPRGQALREPFFAGFRSFPDALYSTYWGDGRLGGRGEAGVRPAWNYEPMVLGYVLALWPTLLTIVGTAAAVVQFLRCPTARWYLLLGVLFCMLFALSYEALRHPYLTVSKAWYALPASVSVCAVFTNGIRWVAGRSASRQALVLGLCTVWAVNSVGAFWIWADRSYALESVGVAMVDLPDVQRASEYLNAAIDANPRNRRAIWQLGRLTGHLGQYRQSENLLRHTLRLDPQHAGAAFDLASVLSLQGQRGEAIKFGRLAAELAPDAAEVHELLADLLARRGELDGAITSLRNVLRLEPDNPGVHARLAALYDKQQRGQLALQHALRAVRTSSEAFGPRVEYASLLLKYGRVEEGLEEYNRVLAQEPRHAAAAAGLAWFLLAYPDKSYRDVPRALQLAEIAVEEDDEQIEHWRTLAAALGEVGRFEEAVEAAEQAYQLASDFGPRRWIEILTEDLERLRRGEGVSFRDRSASDEDNGS